MSSAVRVVERICRSMNVIFPSSNSTKIGIEFYESVIRNLTGISVPIGLPIRDRYKRIIEIVESLVGVPLTHLSPVSLQNCDDTATDNFLEILDFLTDAYARNYSDEKTDCIINGSSSNLSSCENDHDSSSSIDVSNSPTHWMNNQSENSNQTDPRETVLDFQNVDHNHDPKESNMESANCRMCFLHAKLKEYLETSNYIEDEGCHSASSSAISCDYNPRHLVPFETISCLSPRFPTTRGALIKEHVKTLLPKYHAIRSFEKSPSSSPRDLELTKEINGHQSLLDRMLTEFPSLNLDEHDRRILQQKTCQLMRSFVNHPNSLTAENNPRLKHNQSNWIEERQRRRLAQLMRHDRQIDRLREQRAIEAVDRKVREEARERRHQLVRARKYYQEFVKEFRSRKLAKIANEEQVFRNFFEELLRREKDHLNELRKLEHEDRLKKEAEKQQELLTLEHAHQTRLNMLNESLRKQSEERNIRMKEDRLQVQRRRRDLRRLLELNIREIQEAIVACEDSAQLRKRDAHRVLSSKQTYIS